MRKHVIMQKIGIIILLAALFLTGCGKEKTETDDPNTLTHIYAPVVESTNELLSSSGPVWCVEDGYGYVYAYNNNGEGGEYKRGVMLTLTDSEGNILSETEVDTRAYEFAAGDKGVYCFELSADRSEGYLLTRIGWDGTIYQRSVMDWKPGSANTTTPFSINEIHRQIPLAETEDGIAVVWGKRCVLLDDQFHMTAEIELPGQGDMVFVEDDVLWITCKEDESRILLRVEDGVTAESWTLPDVFQDPLYNNVYNWNAVIGCEDGWLYGWDEESVYRWQFTAEEPVIQEVLSFQNSAIPGMQVGSVWRVPGEEAFFSIRYVRGNGYFQQVGLYAPAPDMDLSQLTVLNLVCFQQSRELSELAVEFNRTHKDARIRIIVYDDYQKMQMELDNSLVHADILYGHEWNSMDLYPLMTGEVQPEDIAQCVRNQYESAGELHTISPTFNFHSLYGRQDQVGGYVGWSMEEFLDYAENLPEDVYLMEEVDMRGAAYLLFGSHAYEFFLRNGTASFDSPLYIRYLEFLRTLPEEGQTYMDYGSSNLGDLYAGTITEDQVHVEKGGENLYYSGRIQLDSGSLSSLENLLRVCHIFGTEALAFPGYPTTEGTGIQANYASGTYCIPKTCKDPALAWEFIEKLLLDAAKMPENEQQLISHNFSTLTEPYMDYMESMQGYRHFRAYDGNIRTSGWDLELDANGRLLDMPGAIYEVNDTIMDTVRWLYENAGDTGGYSWDIVDIAAEEEYRFFADAIGAEECADIVQSRVSIYLAENE